MSDDRVLNRLVADAKVSAIALGDREYHPRVQLAFADGSTLTLDDGATLPGHKDFRVGESVRVEIIVSADPWAQR